MKNLRMIAKLHACAQRFAIDSRKDTKVLDSLLQDSASPATVAETDSPIDDYTPPKQVSIVVATTMLPARALSEGIRRFGVFDGPSYDPVDGPTRQPGVRPGPYHEALRTPFGEVGVPGDLLEHNVTDLDLVRNQHRPGERFRG